MVMMLDMVALAIEIEDVSVVSGCASLPAAQGQFAAAGVPMHFGVLGLVYLRSWLGALCSLSPAFVLVRVGSVLLQRMCDCRLRISSRSCSTSAMLSTSYPMKSS